MAAQQLKRNAPVECNAAVDWQLADHKRVSNAIISACHTKPSYK